MTTTVAKSKPKKSDPKEVVIRNAGPIEGEFRFSLSDGYGVYELQGSNGVGKSSVLKLLRLITGHRVDVTVHAGELDGSIEALGVIAPLGRKHPKGELELGTIESDKWGIDDVTDPAGERPEVRDANRIKALAALCKAKADPAPYREMIGDEDFAKLIDRKKLDTDDPLLLQSRIKDSLEQAARLAETGRDEAKEQARLCELAVEGIDLSGECDGKTLADAANQAAAKVAQLESQEKSAKRAHQQADDARKSLEISRDKYKGMTLAESEEAALKAADSRREAEKEVSRIEDLLRTARESARSAIAHEEAMLSARRAAKQQDDLINQLQTLIATNEAIACPSVEEIDKARADLAASRQRQEQGVRIRDAKAKAAQAEAYQDAATALASRAISLRGAAAMTFDILTQSVKLTGIRIENVNGDVRLVVDHPRSKKPCLFDGDNGGLSDGERSIFAMKTLRHLIPSPGLFAVPQRVWQDLDEDARAEIHRAAVEQKLYVFAALPKSGSLRVERPYS